MRTRGPGLLCAGDCGVEHANDLHSHEVAADDIAPAQVEEERVARRLTLLQSPHALQEMIKLHARKLGHFMRQFPVDLESLARQRHHAYPALKILFDIQRRH